MNEIYQLSEGERKAKLAALFTKWHSAELLGWADSSVPELIAHFRARIEGERGVDG